MRLWWLCLLQGQAAAQPLRCRKWRRLPSLHQVQLLLGRWWQPALGVLRVLGASIAAEINGYMKEKEGTCWPIKHPVLDALRTTDWWALRDQAIEAHDMGVRQARAALCLPLPPPHDGSSELCPGSVQ